MAAKTVAVVLTAKSVDRILREGGTSSWRLDRNHARKCEYVVCTRNAHANWTEGPEEHHSAFLVGKVIGVVPAPDHKGRFLILFSEYATVKVPEVWKGDRNPIKYAASLNDFGIDPSKLKWSKMPEPTKPPEAEPTKMDPAAKVTDGTKPLSMADAKKGLAVTFGVSPDAIEITIRG